MKTKKNFVFTVCTGLLFTLISNGQEMLRNNDMDDTSLSPWQVWGSIGTATKDISSQLDGANSARLELTSAGSGANWELGFAQGFAGVIANHTYKISYDAKASVPVTINHQIQRTESPWTAIYTADFLLTTSRQHFSATFSVTSDEPCNFVLGLGSIGLGNTVWIDNIHLVDLGLALSVEDFSANMNYLNSYPNPFNGVITIDFNLIKAENVEIIVFNTLGKKVYTVLDQNYLKGKNYVKLDLSNYNSGVYYVFLKAGVYTQTHKILKM